MWAATVVHDAGSCESGPVVEVARVESLRRTRRAEELVRAALAVADMENFS